MSLRQCPATKRLFEFATQRPSVRQAPSNIRLAFVSHLRGGFFVFPVRCPMPLLVIWFAAARFGEGDRQLRETELRQRKRRKRTPNPNVNHSSHRNARPKPHSQHPSSSIHWADINRPYPHLVIRERQKRRRKKKKLNKTNSMVKAKAPRHDGTGRAGLTRLT